MKHLVFVYVLLFSSFLYAQGTEADLNYSPLVKPESKEIALKGEEKTQKKESIVENTKVDKDKKIGSCRASKMKYVLSASRKLYRAISGKGYKIKKIDLGNFRIGEHLYQSFPQKDGKVVGLLSKKSSAAFVLIDTTRGHVIAKLEFKNCRPMSSSILSPKVSATKIEMDPFKYWGLRVLWTLPKRLGKGKSIKKILRGSVK